MDERPEPVTRLGPDSGGRPPAGAPRVYAWEWGPDQARRPGLPWIGIFLLVFGGLLLLQQLYPDSQSIGSVLVLAIGIAFLVRWAFTRGTGSLYAGSIITALAVPGALTNAGLGREGLGTMSLGVAFLFIALVRATSGGAIGCGVVRRVARRDRRGEPRPAAGRRADRAARARGPRRAPVFGGGLGFDRRR